MRVIQFTPPGSACPVIFGKNVAAAVPGSAVRDIGYGIRSDFELNFGRYLPAFGRADEDDGGYAARLIVAILRLERQILFLNGVYQERARSGAYTQSQYAQFAVTE